MTKGYLTKLNVDVTLTLNSQCGLALLLASLVLGMAGVLATMAEGHCCYQQAGKVVFKHHFDIWIVVSQDF